MNEGSSLPHAKAGKVHLLNVNHFERFAEFPDVPTLTEVGYADSDVPVWFALYAQKGISNEIIAKINAKANEISKTDDMKAKMQSVASVPVVQTPEQIATFMEADEKSIGMLIKNANIKLE
jgi:tripartite-type tricarboxylate transporter receptor subunit TctC